MQITITAKIQVKASPAERSLLDETTEQYRDACDYISNYVFQTHNLKQASFKDKLYRELRERYGLKAQMKQSVIVSRFLCKRQNSFPVWCYPLTS